MACRDFGHCPTAQRGNHQLFLDCWIFDGGSAIAGHATFPGACWTSVSSLSLATLDGRLVRPRGWMPLCRRLRRRPHRGNRSDSHDSISHFGPGAPYTPALRYKRFHDLAPRIAPGQPAPGVTRRNSGREYHGRCSQGSAPEVLAGGIRAGLFRICDTITGGRQSRRHNGRGSWLITVGVRIGHSAPWGASIRSPDGSLAALHAAGGHACPPASRWQPAPRPPPGR